MGVPKVAIVGRPNVGKSSILNWIARKRVAVVDPTPGVTRDRVSYLVQEGERYFELVDTGGIGVIDEKELAEQIERQIRFAIEEADLILFVVDIQTGVVPLDERVADELRRVDKPKLLVVNKCDSPKLEPEVAEFYRLTDAPSVIVSVRGNRNRKELLRAIVEHLDRLAEAGEEEAEPVMKLALVGRRNVGKSTFINALAEQERVIVSEIPGTTRDSIDVRFELDGQVFVAIDTPGVRKRKSLASDVEFYGLVRAQKSIRRADVVLMLFDSQQTISRVDKQLVSEIAENYKPCLFVVNKWDLAVQAEMTTEAWDEYLLNTFGNMPYVPVCFVTAKEKRNVKEVVQVALSLFEQARTRVPTSKLNQVVRAAIEKNPPPYRRNKRPKIYFATQVAVQPPTIVLKCNDPQLFDQTWKRYLVNFLQEQLPYSEVPLKLYFRPRESRERGEPSLEET